MSMNITSFIIVEDAELLAYGFDRIKSAIIGYYERNHFISTNIKEEVSELVDKIEKEYREYGYLEAEPFTFEFPLHDFTIQITFDKDKMKRHQITIAAFIETVANGMKWNGFEFLPQTISLSKEQVGEGNSRWCNCNECR